MSVDSLVALDGPLCGSTYFGTVMSTGFYGITCMQTFLYYVHYGRDPLRTKSFVAALWALNTAHEALIVAGCSYSARTALPLLVLVLCLSQSPFHIAYKVIMASLVNSSVLDGISELLVSSVPDVPGRSHQQGVVTVNRYGPGCGSYARIFRLPDLRFQREEDPRATCMGMCLYAWRIPVSLEPRVLDSPSDLPACVYDP
ncbi:hypothetical protein HD554DRAFT_372137 [Boletus coccyginus]|nr:hypothetical protein HD554DRAFT_372137 [Boletus coccyginus]